MYALSGEIGRRPQMGGAPTSFRLPTLIALLDGAFAPLSRKGARSGRERSRAPSKPGGN